MEKRTWIYVMPPARYEMACDICDGSNITWSEFAGKIWCYDCEIDTDGFGGVFSGPIPVEAAKMLGLSFNRIDLTTGEVLEEAIEDNRLVYKPSGKFVPLTEPQAG